MPIRCHKFFNCKRELECPYFNYEGDNYCWEVGAELTPFVPAGGEDKEVFCKNCLYYQHIQKIMTDEP